MGLLVDGEWRDQWYDTSATGGRFERQASSFRRWVTPDGKKDGFPAASGRYHLYVSYACPWAHRTLILRKLKQLEEHISVSVVHWYMGEAGWTFADAEGVVPDPVKGAEFLYQVYLAADARYTGRATVPVLWDLRTNTIVNNESADIIRMLNSAFDEFAAPGDYYPAELRDQIDAINDRVYTTVNNGVYRAGFATTQQAYEEAVGPLFETLDWLDRRLDDCRWLVGDRTTEADWRLFTTLLRFDAVYFGHFKCNCRRIVDYPNLWPYLRDLYQVRGIADTVHFDHIKPHYYMSHPAINPTRVVPVGPVIDFGAAHDRELLG
ncbi:MAG TPA: glutathione S-transferase family protein [Woeseiaceae bacterium]|nr:glutathione S-transferase family protein [Woeseiaceae bacterium]